jgi:quercetin dioxygenase-like cupin family protein
MASTSFQNLSALITDIPDDSIVSRTIFDDDRLKGVLFGFAPGQELSEHTSAHPAVLHFIEGQAEVTLGDEMMAAEPGSWVHMPARLPHGITANSRVIMLLLMFKG